VSIGGRSSVVVASETEGRAGASQADDRDEGDVRHLNPMPPPRPRARAAVLLDTVRNERLMGAFLLHERTLTDLGGKRDPDRVGLFGEVAKSTTLKLEVGCC
jgi:hypothetical protein